MSGNEDGSLAGNRCATSADLKFSYAGLPASVERFLRGQADRIRRQCTSSIVQIGKALLEAKRHLSHGAFLRWVESEVGIPCRTAQAYMRAAQWSVGKSAAVAHLPASAIYMLSANGVPEKFVADLLNRVEAGERIGAVAIRQELRAFMQSRDGQRLATEADVQQIQQEHSDIGTAGSSSIAELAAFLARKLSELDFARVCQILTSDSVLSDPGLAEKLDQQFRTEPVRGMAAIEALPQGSFL